MNRIDELKAWKIQYRAATIEDLDTEKSEMLVRAVPYNTPTSIGGDIIEEFKQGAFARAAKAPDRLLVHRDHGGPVVGRGITLEDREDGPWIRARLSRTSEAKDMLLDIADGIASDISIEFMPMPRFMDIEARSDGKLYVSHRRAHLLGYAIVPEGAYADKAFIASMRDDDADDRAREAARLWLEAYKRGEATPE